jgi:hypothetical protein
MRQIVLCYRLTVHETYQTWIVMFVIFNAQNISFRVELYVNNLSSYHMLHVCDVWSASCSHVTEKLQVLHDQLVIILFSTLFYTEEMWQLCCSTAFWLCMITALVVGIHCKSAVVVKRQWCYTPVWYLRVTLVQIPFVLDTAASIVLVWILSEV